MARVLVFHYEVPEADYLAARSGTHPMSEKVIDVSFGKAVAEAANAVMKVHPDYYQNVAMLRIDVRDESDTVAILNAAYQATTHRDEAPWYLNQSVKMFKNNRRLRSSSIGDIFIVTSHATSWKAYAVDRTGFVEVNPPVERKD